MAVHTCRGFPDHFQDIVAFKFKTSTGHGRSKALGRPWPARPARPAMAARPWTGHGRPHLSWIFGPLGGHSGFKSKTSTGHGRSKALGRPWPARPARPAMAARPWTGHGRPHLSWIFGPLGGHSGFKSKTSTGHGRSKALGRPWPARPARPAMATRPWTGHGRPHLSWIFGPLGGHSGF